MEGKIPCLSTLQDCLEVSRDFNLQNVASLTLANVAQLVGVLSSNKKAAGSIPGQGTYLGAGSIPSPGVYEPGPGAYGRQPVNASLLHWCFSLPLSLKAVKKNVAFLYQ